MTFFNIVKMLSVCAFLLPAHSFASEQAKFDAQHFVSLTFHDVRDDVRKSGDRDIYAINTQNLVQFFEWLKRSEWTPITLKQIMASREHGIPLPKNAVLISFDDGALSGYSHVYPLVKQYQIPVVFALVTSWTEGNTQAAYEAYGQNNLMSWKQLQDIQKSGLVEFASHSHDLHKGVLANIQKNEKPAALTRQYNPSKHRYESEQEYSQRIYNDLLKSKQVLQQKLGIDSLAIIWPYGAVNQQVTQIANQAGFPLSFSLGTEKLNDANDATFQRGIVSNNPTAENLREQLTGFMEYGQRQDYEPMRGLQFDLAQFSQDSTLYNQQLGSLLNNLSAFKTNTLIVNALTNQKENTEDQAYFPTTHLKLAQDILSRTHWQTRTRVFHRVYVQMPIFPDLNRTHLAVDLSRDLIRNNPNLDGIILKTDQQLACRYSTVVNSACLEKEAQILKLTQQVKAAVTPYLNQSNPFHLTLQLSLSDLTDQGLEQIVKTYLPYVSLLNIEIDSLSNPNAYQKFIAQVGYLTAAEKARLMVTLVNQDQTSAKELQILQQQFLNLQRHGIQKLVLSNYRFDNAKAVHEQLFTPLSLNESPISYRNPFIDQHVNGAHP
ncbi:poly-beta-1,6-N-acetyl-D-glucosamine N-deacetylase PgaB [Acinetobacter sp. NIPH 2100]|uniref:poly-beta-1,6-N-acetyl-D-glucosamine N-deacetylase PgaB n=1 Tax=Acinetobacter sp. NIPH 2100 TaxID=1217708 RepID=UPI0002CFEAF5|nr:poly-beta-1,6-N-acetyl-D-glucosamine N-deacetylase PgaB [Acinetobacter sp. NIPH 2100]ENX41018.1 poly-beta-1,6-N-acetyl-D-glucosamine N-deacetylase PgaB [Acinetobacter sp. NIPH 2100]